MTIMRIVGSCLAGFLVLGVAITPIRSGDDLCAAWNLEGYRLGMTAEEALELRPAPGLARAANAQPASGMHLRFSRAGKIPVRDPAGAWKASVGLKNGILNRCKVIYPDGDPVALAARFRDRLDRDPEPGAKSRFRSLGCNALIEIARAGKRGVRVTLERVFPVKTGPERSGEVPVFKPPHEDDPVLPRR